MKLVRLKSWALLRSSILIACLLGTGPVKAIEVDLELVIAADISDSMDVEEQRLQRSGYAAAFRDPDIIAAIQQGPLGRIAVTLIEWADLAQPRVTVPWMLIDGPAAGSALAAKLEASAFTSLRRTSISGALSFAGHLLDHNDYDSLRRVIDISGDGPNNQGEAVDVARDRIVAGNVVINGLPIMIDFEDPRNPFNGSFDKRQLDLYYEDCVIGGPGAFIVPIRSLDAMADSIRQKLMLEIAAGPGSVMLTSALSRPRVPC